MPCVHVAMVSFIFASALAFNLRAIYLASWGWNMMKERRFNFVVACFCSLGLFTLLYSNMQTVDKLSLKPLSVRRLHEDSDDQSVLSIFRC